MNRECLNCGLKLPDNVRGAFCDEDCEIKYDRKNAGFERDYQRSMTGYLRNKLW